MCMEDVRIGRASQPLENIIPDTSVSVLMLDDDPHRMFFTVPSDTVGNIWITTAKTAVVGDGILIPPNTQALTISLHTHGAVVTKRWFVISSTGSRLTVLQGTMNKTKV